MSDPLTDLINDVQQNGIRWVSVITFLALYRKERRNHLLNRRDAAIFHNLRILMEDRGLGDQWKDGPKLGLQPMPPLSLRQLYLLLRKVTKHQKRRMSMLTNILKANLSKKLISALVAIGVAALNQKFGLNLSENDVTLILGLSLAHISLQTIIDSIKAWAIAKSSAVIQQGTIDIKSGIEKAILDPNTTYQTLFPKIKDVHDGIQKIYQDAFKNDGSQACKDALQVYTKIYDIFQSMKPPVTIPEVIQQESA